MQRVLEVLRMLTWLVCMALAIYVGLTVVPTLRRLHRDLEQQAMRTEQILQEHREQLREHERRMERSLPPQP
jgi:hypothetical protein